MVRLSRAQQQARNRARVLAAAREEFTERGYRDAKIDRIADRADLTRGAVYSNFPGKRALYLSVLAETDGEPTERSTAPGHTAAEALGAFARARVARLPLSETDAPPRGGITLSSEVLSDEPIRRAFAQLVHLDARLLGSALEALETGTGRRVRVAETALITLYGAGQMAEIAPGLTDPFNVIRACERIADLDLEDDWPLPHLAHVPPAELVDEPWTPPEVMDVVGGRPAVVGRDGLVLVLGIGRLEAAEEALRAVPDGTPVMLAVVGDNPAEHVPLARASLTDLYVCLRQAFPAHAVPTLEVVLEGADAVAAAAGATDTGDDTETAVRVAGGRIVARSTVRGACHAVAVSAAVSED